MEPLRHELCIELSLRPRLLWAAALLAFLAFPQAAGTGETLQMATYVNSPSGVFSALTTIGQTNLADNPNNQALVTLAGPENTAIGEGYVAVGEVPLITETAKFTVRGHLQVTGCIELKTTKRCSWSSP